MCSGVQEDFQIHPSWTETFVLLLEGAGLQASRSQDHSHCIVQKLFTLLCCHEQWLARLGHLLVTLPGQQIQLGFHGVYYDGKAEVWFLAGKDFKDLCTLITLPVDIFPWDTKHSIFV